MSSVSNCPCDELIHPRTLSNPAARSALDYRIGDFRAFRRALLRPRPNEVGLEGWKPTGGGDLAVQIVEWFAYVADVLTFYNERIANEAFLRTATLPESVARLVRLLGYRPRPGIGATGNVAALLSRPIATAVPAGLKIKSKPPPGKQPQTFETHAATAVPPDAVAVEPPPVDRLVTPVDGESTILLRGTRIRTKVGDRILLFPRKWKPNSQTPLVTVKSITRVKDARGQPATRMALMAKPQLDSQTKATAYRVLTSRRTAHLWQYTKANGIALKTSSAHLDSVHRELAAGQPVLFEDTSTSGAKPDEFVVIESVGDDIWYANADSGLHPETPPAPPPNTKVPVPVPHTRFAFKPPLPSAWKALAEKAQLSVDWVDVAAPIPTPAAMFPSSDPVTVTAIPPAHFPNVGAGMTVQLEDSLGFGFEALASPGSSSAQLKLSGITGRTQQLRAPFRLLFDLVPVSRGETVGREVLGSGDATVAGQEFVIKQAALTYLAGGSASGTGYRSTLRVWVDGVEWTEVPSFYDQPDNARVFVTCEDEAAKTHVLFGDGVNGARLPSGVANVTASYRFGSGRDAPPAGTLNSIANPLPNLKAVRNPVAAGGGADPDPPEQIRRYAPRSVLTFGRAVSADDYEVIAAQAPGVNRARSYWTWDPAAQRALVTLYVGDNAAALSSATAALAAADDPNRPVSVQLAAAVPLRLALAVRIAGDRDPVLVLAGVRAALVDPDRGILGANVVRIGAPLFASRIDAAVVDCAGVLAVHDVVVSVDRGSGFAVEPGFRIDPGQGAFFQLADGDLTLTQES